MSVSSNIPDHGCMSGDVMDDVMLMEESLCEMDMEKWIMDGEEEESQITLIIELNT